MLRRIKPRHTGIKTVGRRVTGMVKPGWYGYLPGWQRIHSVPHEVKLCRVQARIVTQDLVATNIALTVRHQIHPDNARLAFERIKNPGITISQQLIDSAVSCGHETSFTKLYHDYEDYGRQVRTSLARKMVDDGLSVISVHVTDIDVDKDKVGQHIDYLTRMRRLNESKIGLEALRFAHSCDVNLWAQGYNETYMLVWGIFSEHRWLFGSDPMIQADVHDRELVFKRTGGDFEALFKEVGLMDDPTTLSLTEATN